MTDSPTASPDFWHKIGKPEDGQRCVPSDHSKLAFPPPSATNQRDLNRKRHSDEQKDNEEFNIYVRRFEPSAFLRLFPSSHGNFGCDHSFPRYQSNSMHGHVRSVL